MVIHTHTTARAHTHTHTQQVCEELLVSSYDYRDEHVWYVDLQVMPSLSPVIDQYNYINIVDYINIII